MGTMTIDKCRNIKELEELCKHPKIQDVNWIVENPHHYCFYDDENNSLLGVIYMDEKEDKLFLSGISVRKITGAVQTAIDTVCKAYKQDIYATTKEKPAIVALKRAGFKKVEENLYRRKA